MDRAYLFPFNLAIDRQHAASATRVTLDTDYEELVQASHNGRLRCCYVACLERVKPVRRDAFDDSDLRCFSHVEAAYASVPCPYRDPHEPGETTDERRKRREHNLRKVIENDLRVALEDKLAARGIHATVSGSDLSSPEPCIGVTGFGAPFEIRGLAPGCERLWSQAFDGTKDGKPVLFFVVEGDVPRLQQPFIDEHLLQRRPAIVVRPSQEEWEAHTWVATSTLRRVPAAVHPLRDLDLISVDSQRLLGVDLPAETLFIPTPYREAIERIEGHLGGESNAPAIAILRSLVEGLLVQGAGMRPALFGHKELALPDVENLLRDSETLRFCGGDPILAPMLMRVFATTVADLHRAVSGSRGALAKVEVERTALAEQLSVAVRNGKAAEARVIELEKKFVASRDELARAEEALRKGKVERDALQAKADKLTTDLATAHSHLNNERERRAELNKHVLVRLDSYLHH